MKAPDKLSDVLTLPNSSGMKAQRRWNNNKKDKKIHPCLLNVDVMLLNSDSAEVVSEVART